MKHWMLCLGLALGCIGGTSEPLPEGQEARGASPDNIRQFFGKHCIDCHGPDAQKGGLRLDTLTSDFSTRGTFELWVKVHDRIRSGEMPPPKQKRPVPIEADAVIRVLDLQLTAADRKNLGEGRAALRRLNRAEYENTLRDLLALPGLNVRDLLPEDGRAHGFDKVSDALDLSYVQLAKYMEATDVALDLAIASQLEKPEIFRKRFPLGHEGDFQDAMTHGDAIPIKDQKYDASAFPIVRDHPMAKVASYGGTVGTFRAEDESHKGRIWSFSPRYEGRYRLRLSTWSFQWEKGAIKPALKTETVRLNVHGTGQLIGYFDAPSLKPTVHEIEAWLPFGQYIQLTADLWKASVSATDGKTAEFVGPGVAFDWLEIEGPLYDQWPPASHRRLFGDLPMGPLPEGDIRPPRRVSPNDWHPNAGRNGAGKLTFATVVSEQPASDAQRLLTDFLPRAFRRPVKPEEVSRYLAIVRQRLEAKVSFEDAMRAAYKAALCSPSFLFVKQTPDRLDDWALASRLSYFLWNSPPDDVLQGLAEQGRLRDPVTLRAQVERLVADPKSGRFIRDFLDQWLDLREIRLTTPDPKLYPEFRTYLGDSMLAESRAFFRELLEKNLSVANVIHSDFALINQRLAEHYGIPGVVGTAIRRVPLPSDAHRGGFLTQGAVLKVTANGTATTPVKRGAWVMSKILGKPPKPPPGDVPAVEPDVQGATTIREQLARHRASPACASCHAQIDPPGFALESYDAIGGWRQRYRSLGAGDPVDSRAAGMPRWIGADYRWGPPVDATGELSGGGSFTGIDQLKKLLLEQDRQIARNFAAQLITYATGAPISYSDRAALEVILDRAKAGSYGVRTLIHEIVQSPLFLKK